jgi:hypothetical protein
MGLACRRFGWGIRGESRARGDSEQNRQSQSAAHSRSMVFHGQPF